MGEIDAERLNGSKNIRKHKIRRNEAKDPRKIQSEGSAWEWKRAGGDGRVNGSGGEI